MAWVRRPIGRHEEERLRRPVARVSLPETTLRITVTVESHLRAMADKERAAAEFREWFRGLTWQPVTVLRPYVTYSGTDLY